jgi:hypothetical protein
VNRPREPTAERWLRRVTTARSIKPEVTELLDQLAEFVAMIESYQVSAGIREQGANAHVLGKGRVHSRNRP